MLRITQLDGFNSGGNGVVTLISAGAGTAIGNMTEQGGLAAGFDGNTSQGRLAGPYLTNTAAGYIGKDWGSGVTHTVVRADVIATNNAGFCDDGTPLSIVLSLEASTDNFGTSVVDLGGAQTVASSYTASNGVTKTITPTILAAYRYHRIKQVKSTAGNVWPCYSEVQFYELV